mmetsp:Transcript_10548/g.19256  ORF Transcript_10548/g.19256 Transcript_10548/m.19256 type:complete len:394 (-) Transcript_10548:21-1202(-)
MTGLATLRAPTRLVRRLRQLTHRALRAQHLEMLASRLSPTARRYAQAGEAEGDGRPFAVLACVSSGSDSMAMLDLLHHCKDFDPTFELHVAHFDHGLRGVESDMDRKFVEDTCEGMPGVKSLVTRALASESDSEAKARFSQEEGRVWRDGMLRDIIDSELAHLDVAVALAHHSDDNIETMLLKILRGANIMSLQGMSPLVTTEGGLTKLRPLLSVSKSELVQYLRDLDLSWREDSSNASPVYSRNRVRNEVIPLLQDLAGSPKALTDRFQELSSQARLLQTWVDSELNDDSGDSDGFDHCSLQSQDGDKCERAAALESASVFRPNTHQPEFLERERLRRFLVCETGESVFARSVEMIWTKIKEKDRVESKVDLGGEFQAVVHKDKTVDVITRC